LAIKVICIRSYINSQRDISAIELKVELEVVKLGAAGLEQDRSKTVNIKRIGRGTLTWHNSGTMNKRARL
jgi:hypothetical protein